MSLLLVIGAALLALLGLPLFLVIFGVTLLGQQSVGLDPRVMLVELFDKLTENPVFLTIPLFAHAGFVLSASGAPVRLVALVRATLGWLPGGPALVTIVTCALFTAFTGASGVTIIALGGLLLPLLLREGYRERYGLGLVTTGGSLGLLLPPSLPLIIFALIASNIAPVPVQTLFLAALVPGLLLILVLALHGAHIQRRAGPVARAPFDAKRVMSALRASAWELPIPLLICVGVFGGYVTVAQAAALVAVYVALVEVVILGDLDAAEFLRVTVKSQVLVGAILVIIMAALAMTNFLTDQEVPRHLLALLEKHIDSKISFLIALNLFLLAIGCLMDIYSAILVVVPLVMPIALRFGVDPVHLGVIFLTNLEIGYSTPPVGINLFISSLRFDRPVLALYRASLPFIGLLLLCLLVITWVPALSLGLVRLVEGTGEVEVSWQRRAEARAEGGAGELTWARRAPDSERDWFELATPGEGAAAGSLDDLVLRYRPREAADLAALGAGLGPVPVVCELIRAGSGGAAVAARFELSLGDPRQLAEQVLEPKVLALQPDDPDVPLLPEDAHATSELVIRGDAEGRLSGRLASVAVWFPEAEDADEQVFDLELTFTCDPQLDLVSFQSPGPGAHTRSMPDVVLARRTLDAGEDHVALALERVRPRPFDLRATWRMSTSELATPTGARVPLEDLRVLFEDLPPDLFPGPEAEVSVMDLLLEERTDGRLRGRVEAVLQAPTGTFDVRVRFELPLREP